MAIVYSNNPADTAGSVTYGTTTYTWKNGVVTSPADYVNSTAGKYVVYNCTVGGRTARTGETECYFINAVLDGCSDKDSAASGSYGFFGGYNKIIYTTVSNNTITNSRGMFYGNNVVYGSVITGNVLDDYGVFHKKSGNMYVTGSTFSFNYSNTGAAVSSQGSSGGTANEWVYVSGTADEEMLFLGNTVTGGGGAIASANNRGQFDIKGATFSQNVSRGVPGKNPCGGGAIVNNGQVIVNSAADGTRTQFTGNTAAGHGGAIFHIANTAGLLCALTVNDAVFKENVSYSGGGAVAATFDMTLTGNTFVDNYSTANGGALYIDGGSATLTGNVFSGNSTEKSGGAINVTSNAVGVTINGGSFLTATDTINSAGVPVEFTGDIELNASVSGTGFKAKNAHFTLKNSEAIELAAIDFTAGGNSITIDGTAAVDFNGQSFEGASVKVKLDKATASSGVIATEFNADYTVETDMVKDSRGYYKAADDLLALNYSANTLELEKKGLVVNSADEFDAKLAAVRSGKLPYLGFASAMTIEKPAAIVFDSAAKQTVTISDNVRVTFDGKNETRFMVIGTSNTVTLENMDLVNFYHGSSDGGAINNSGVLTLKNVKIDGCQVGDAVGTATQKRSAAINNGGTLTVIDSVISNNKLYSNVSGVGGGAIYAANKTTITNTTFSGNTIFKGKDRWCRGAAIGVGQDDLLTINGSTFYQNASTQNNYGAIYADQKSNVYINGYTVGGVVQKTVFDDNVGGAIYSNVGNIYADQIIIKNSNGSVAALQMANNSDTATTLTVSNAEFSNNAKGAISIANVNATITNSTFATADDWINIFHENGTVTFGGNIALHADITLRGVGTYIIGKGTNFTIARDFSDMCFAVKSEDWSGADTVIATGVTDIKDYIILGDKNFVLTVNENSELILSKREEQVLAGDSFVGNAGSNLIVSGSAKTYIANKVTSADTLITTVKGGEIKENFIGGAFAKAVDGAAAAAIGRVEVNFTENARVSGQSYIGGYVYGLGGNTASKDAQMTIDNVALNLSGGEVEGNIFAGIHARQAGNASVSKVNISVTGGSHGRIYAGGWAEGNSESTVGASTITVSGGKVDFIYGGGANGQGTTSVTTTTITISGDAKVGTIFMSGRYGYSSVGTVTLTFKDDAKAMKRLSGLSSAGVNNAANAVVNVQTALTADGIDYVKKFVISEGGSVTSTGEFLLGTRDADTEAAAKDSFTLFDFNTDGFEGNWDAIAGIDDFEHAMFSINGGDVVAWNGIDALAVTSGKLTYNFSYNEDTKVVTLAQA